MQAQPEGRMLRVSGAMPRAEIVANSWAPATASSR